METNISLKQTRSENETNVSRLMLDTEAEKLMMTYHPGNQIAFSKYPERCVTGKSPTLIEINDYQNFCCIKEDSKMDDNVVNELSSMIIANLFYLKLTEVMLFFQRLKCGIYGEIYGCIEPSRIMRALRTFINERSIILDNYDKKKMEEEFKEYKKNAMTREEWEKMKRNTHTS